mmetsp:Transcript_102813/g.331728  ORF Transcript_102813/g.331728 Transcript_102813/m.331728 type:complete len:243 (-) Transcript_102813:168-896(-)
MGSVLPSNASLPAAAFPRWRAQQCCSVRGNGLGLRQQHHRQLSQPCRAGRGTRPPGRQGDRRRAGGALIQGILLEALQPLTQLLRLGGTVPGPQQVAGCLPHLRLTGRLRRRLVRPGVLVEHQAPGVRAHLDAAVEQGAGGPLVVPPAAGAEHGFEPVARAGGGPGAGAAGAPCRERRAPGRCRGGALRGQARGWRGGLVRQRRLGNVQQHVAGGSPGPPLAGSRLGRRRGHAAGHAPGAAG